MTLKNNSLYQCKKSHIFWVSENNVSLLEVVERSSENKDNLECWPTDSFNGMWEKIKENVDKQLK